jgi:hypothetical protein
MPPLPTTPFDLQNQAIEKMKAESLKRIAKSLEEISAKMDKMSELENVSNLLATIVHEGIITK